MIRTYKTVLDEFIEKYKIERDFYYRAGNYILNVAKKFGIELSLEQFEYIVNPEPKLLCLAGAGSGKTTTTQFKQIFLEYYFKIPRSKIVNLVYNDHNVEDIKEKFIKIASPAGINIREEVYCTTFHKFAKSWVLDFDSYFGFINGMFVASEDDIPQMLGHAIKRANIPVEIKDLDKKLMSVYSKSIEEMVEEWWHTPDFLKIGVSSETAIKIIEDYGKIKKIKGLIDFQDMLILFKRLFVENPRDLQGRYFLDRFRSVYSVIMIDEYQDSSNLMKFILLNMGLDKMVLIGDLNQSIYGFRGANPYNDFKSTFGGETVNLVHNRRCRKKIVETANRIVKLQTLIDPIEGVAAKDGGNVEYRPYTTRIKECMDIAELLKDIDNNTVVCFRNRNQAFLLMFTLLEKGVSFRTGNVKNPFSDLLSKSLLDIFRLMDSPNNKFFQKECLFKILPRVTRANINEMLKNQEDNFWDLKYPYEDTYGFRETLYTLADISAKLRSGVHVCKVFNELFDIFKKYYWKYQGEGFEPELEEVILYFFNRDMTLRQVISDIMKKLEVIERGSGPVLTTLHSLKGLEYKNVIIMDVTDGTLPSETNSVEEFEGEVRLMYVAITRAMDNLYVYHSGSSLFVETMKADRVERQNTNTETEIEELVELELEMNEDEEFEEKVNVYKAEIEIDEQTLYSEFLGFLAK